MDVELIYEGGKINTTLEQIQQTADFLDKKRFSGNQKEAFLRSETGESIAAEQLKTIVERIERVNEEIDGLTGDRREIFAEAKGNGFDVKAIRRLITLRKKEDSERQEEEAIFDLYKQALGMS